MKTVVRDGRLTYTRNDFRPGWKGMEEYMWNWLQDMGFRCGHDGYGVGLIEGQRGAGKSLFGYTIAWWVRHLFNVGITFDNKPETIFGDYTFFDLPWDLLKERKYTDDVAKRGSRWEGEEIQKLKLYKCFAFFDEFYQVAHKRSVMGIMTREFEDLLKQLRHLDSFFLMAMPDKNEVDTQGIDAYVTVDIQASWSTYARNRALYVVYNRQKMITSPFSIYGPNYYGLYRSKNPIRARKWIDPKLYKKWLKHCGREEEESAMLEMFGEEIRR